MSSIEEDTSKEMTAEPRKVVIAMDGSDNAIFALNWYKEHVHKTIDYVYLIHVFEWHHAVHNSKWHFSPQHNDVETLGPLIREEHAMVNARLEKFAQELQNLQIKGEVKVVHTKNPGEGVVHEAKELAASFIVTGSRGLGKVRRTILGSVSDYILHHASVPVIICHKPHHEH